MKFSQFYAQNNVHFLLFRINLIRPDVKEFFSDSQDNWCPLAVAAKEGYTDICLILIDHNAELEHKDMVKIYTLSFWRKGST